ncbi:hypothetical protein KP509_36G047500 [Ceratopteris richardii]|uniref:Uncharacterized protein n=1 Tax=Ceratopteris richardii TaxID=49495 RepID=A0A8T2QCV6_CERRI|nr:hypothetical protein KP509_36G047500 [Ceratopteris richardii]
MEPCEPLCHKVMEVVRAFVSQSHGGGDARVARTRSWIFYRRNNYCRVENPPRNQILAL